MVSLTFFRGGRGAVAALGDTAAELIALEHLLRNADAPFASWLGMVLSASSDATLAERGRQMVNAVLAHLPPLSATRDHADLVAYCVLAHSQLATADQRDLADRLPKAQGDLRLRSRLYASPIYVYLIARGFASHLRRPDEVESDVADRMRENALSEARLSSLCIQFATLLELARPSGVAPDLVRHFHARVVTASRDASDAIAARWLLERFARLWPRGRESSALRVALDTYVTNNHPSSVDPADFDAPTLAMRAEVLAAKTPRYFLASESTFGGAVARYSRRAMVWTVFASAAAVALPLVVAAHWLYAKGLSPAPATTAFLLTWLPAVAWIALIVLRRQRKDFALAGATTLGVVYFVVAAWAVTHHSARVLPMLTNELLVAAVPVLIMTVFGALPARKLGE